MKELQVFNNEEFGKVRVVMVNNKPYAVANDVAIALGYKNPADAVRTHTKGSIKYRHLTNGGKQEIKIIPEGDIYRLIMKSKLPAAEKFESWVMDEVLPTIRKHGMYATDELLNNPDLLIEVATKLKEERAARIAAEKERNKLIHQSKLYTSSEIAKELGMSSASKLNKFLEEKKVQYKLNNTWLLYSEYSESGLASIKQQILDNGHVIYDRRWTGKGRDFILDLYLNRK